jgi:hypothetical protein
MRQPYWRFVALSLLITLWGLYPFPLASYLLPVVAWAILFAYGLYIFRLRALWLLLELPFVTFWIWVLMICAANRSCP